MARISCVVKADAWLGHRLDYEGIAIFHMDGTRIAEVWSQSDRALKFAAL